MRAGVGAWIVLVLLAVFPAGSGLAQTALPSEPAIKLGADVILADVGPLAGRRLGLVTHRAATTAGGEPTMQVLSRAGDLRITALFAPEHGLDGSYDAGRRVPHAISRGTPVYSLHGGSFSPTRQMLARVDVLVVDLQDVGVRPFTYASTMVLVMRAAAASGKPVVILDRPNPLGGTIVDGPVLEPPLSSFIGMYPIPYVHGMTLGELATLYNRAFGINARLTVVPMVGWRRSMIWADTGLPWTVPSPGLIDPDIAPYYAATGPLDGTNLWNGVATESRFRVVLAPWIDAPRLADRLNRYGLPGVRFTPSALPHPHSGEIWQGVRLTITDPRAFRPTTTIVHVLAEIRRMHGSKLTFKRPRRGPYLFDLVWGTRQVRLALQRGASAAQIIAAWAPELERFKELRRPYFLYE
ncbi:MAG TPA: DUF1343 domain-containing protein [bacterium]|nr:DUF1343 domain-containing protein [bacterium]